MPKLGSVTYQVIQAFLTLKAFGQSKYEAKENFLLTAQTREVSKFMHDFAQNSGISSIQTYYDYQNIAIACAKFAKEQYGVKDIKNLTDMHAQAFLQTKIQANVAKQTLQKYVSALNKFQVALKNQYKQSYDFKLQDISKNSNLQVKERSGYWGYKDPEKLLNYILSQPNIKENAKLAAQLQLETGVRAGKDLNNIHFNGDKVYAITKGGKILELVDISNQLKRDLKNYLDNNNLKVFKVGYKAYTNVLKKASAMTGQKYEGTHGLRHNHHDIRKSQLIRSGMNPKKASLQTSSEMGHNREVYNYNR